MSLHTPAVVLVAATSTPLLSALKYALLAVLWLFFILVLRAVLTEVRPPGGAVTSAPEPLPARQSAARFSRGTQVGPPAGQAPSAPPPGRAPLPGVIPFPGAAAGTPPPPSPDELARAEWAAVRTDRGGVSSLSVVEPAKESGRSVSVAGDITLGRAPACSFCVPDDSFVSSTHARVWRRDGQVWVEDLGSTNGTFLNERRLDGPTVIRPGDRLRMGKTVLEAMR